MYGEFTSACNRFYYQTQQLKADQEAFKNLLEDAPPYRGETHLNQLDTLIRIYRDVQAAKKRVDETMAAIIKTERDILLMMRHFEMAPNTILTGIIPDELHYKIWADETDRLHIIKTKHLEPEEDGPNVIRVKLNRGRNALEH